MGNSVDKTASEAKFGSERERPELLDSGAASMPMLVATSLPDDSCHSQEDYLPGPSQSQSMDMWQIDETPLGARVLPSSPTASSSSALLAEEYQALIAQCQAEQREAYRLANKLMMCPTLEELNRQSVHFSLCVTQIFHQVLFIGQQVEATLSSGFENFQLCRPIYTELQALKLFSGASVLRVAEIITAMTQLPDDCSPFPSDADIKSTVHTLTQSYIQIAHVLLLYEKMAINPVFAMSDLESCTLVSLRKNDTRLPLLILEFRRRVTGIIDECKALEDADLQVKHLDDQPITRAILAQVWKVITTKQTLSLWLSEHPCPQPAMAAPEAKGDGGEESPPRRELISDNDGVLLPELVELMIVQLTETEVTLANALARAAWHVRQDAPPNEWKESDSDLEEMWSTLVDRYMLIEETDLREDLERKTPATQGHEEAARNEFEMQMARLCKLAKEKLADEHAVKVRTHQYRGRLHRIQAFTKVPLTAIERGASEETLSMMLKTIQTSMGEAMSHILVMRPPTREEQEENKMSNNSNNPQRMLQKGILEDDYIKLYQEMISWVRDTLVRLAELTALPGDELLTFKSLVSGVRRATATALSVLLNHLSHDEVLHIVRDKLLGMRLFAPTIDPWQLSLQGVNCHPMWVNMVPKVGLWMRHWRAKRAVKRETREKGGNVEKFIQPSHAALLCRAHTLFDYLARGATRSLAEQPLNAHEPPSTAAQHHTVDRALLLVNTFHVLSRHPAGTAFQRVLPDHLANALSADDVARAIVERVTDEAADEAKQEGAHQALLGVLQNVDQSVNSSRLYSVEEQLKSAKALDAVLRDRMERVAILPIPYIRYVWLHIHGGQMPPWTTDPAAQEEAMFLSWETYSPKSSNYLIEVAPPVKSFPQTTILLRLTMRGLSELTQLAASEEASLREAADSLQEMVWPLTMLTASQLAASSALTLVKRVEAQKKELSEKLALMKEFESYHGTLKDLLQPLLQSSLAAPEKSTLFEPWLITLAQRFCDRLLSDNLSTLTAEERATLQGTVDTVQRLHTLQLSPEDHQHMNRDMRKTMAVLELQEVLLKMARMETPVAAQEKMALSEWQHRNAVSLQLLNELRAQLSAVKVVQNDVDDGTLTVLKMAYRALSSVQHEMQQHHAHFYGVFERDVHELLNALQGVLNTATQLFSSATGGILPQHFEHKVPESEPHVESLLLDNILPENVLDMLSDRSKAESAQNDHVDESESSVPPSSDIPVIHDGGDESSI